MALFKHKLTGKVVEYPAHYANHPVFGKQLILVDSATQAQPEAQKEEPIVVETEVISEPLTSAAETEVAEEIEVNLENN
jgi:hypothetical protein